MFHSIILTGAPNLSRLKNLSADKAGYFPQDIFNNLTPGNPDFIFIKPEPGKSIGIKEIRILKKKISRKPFHQKYKIIFIQEAENLTIEAQNALLKTLEEPPGHTIIILSVPSESSLLPTIQSRCRIFHLPREKTSPPPEDCPEIKVLKKILASPKIGERIQLIQPYTKADAKQKQKARPKALEFCQKSLLFLSCTSEIPVLAKFISRSFPSNLSPSLSNLSLFLLLKSLQNSHDLLQKNLSVKLVMENMVLEW